MNNDLISKSELIEKIKDFIPWFGQPEKVACANEIIELITHQPTVEQPQGKWIKTEGNSFECPFCHRLFDFGDNYCGFCGADMRGGKNEGAN